MGVLNRAAAGPVLGSVTARTDGAPSGLSACNEKRPPTDGVTALTACRQCPRSWLASHRNTCASADVLRLLALGHANQEIAQQLFISVRTAETHRAHIMQKLSLSNRAELVRYALAEGLLEPE